MLGSWSTRVCYPMKILFTIKPCDKGAGIIILDFHKYMDSCYNHLNSKQKQADGSFKPYYEKIDETSVEKIKNEIDTKLKEALENELITNNEFDAMKTDDKKAAKFYEIFKVHKQHIEGETPPERPIISSSGSYTENIGLYVENFLQKISNKHPSFLQDTPDFLREIEALNEKQTLPENTILVTIDVTALYTNIPQNEGLEAVKEALEDVDDSDFNEFLLRMLEIVLKYNIFEFNKELFIQLIGTAMGSRPAPSYAKIFLWQTK